MKQSDSTVLGILRKSTLKSLSDDVFLEVEKAVERDGILNLVGSARDAVHSAVKKYNMNHDGKGQFSSGSGGASPISSSDKIKNAETMFGTGSKQHLEAMTRFGGDSGFKNPNQKRSLRAIASDIHNDPGFKGNVRAYASPYTQAMASMHDVTENYGADTGKSVVAYALSNLGSWRGDTARSVKTEMKAMIK